MGGTLHHERKHHGATEEENPGVDRHLSNIVAENSKGDSGLQKDEEYPQGLSVGCGGVGWGVVCGVVWFVCWHCGTWTAAPPFDSHIRFEWLIWFDSVAVRVISAIRPAGCVCATPWSGYGMV